MSKFKIGDKVEFVVGGLCGLEDNKWWEDENLTLGFIYEVCKVNAAGNIKVEEHGFWHHKDHFKLINNKSKTKENKMNKNISEVFDKTKDALLVEEYLGNQIGTTFIDGLMLTDKKAEVLAEAKRLEKEEKDNK